MHRSRRAWLVCAGATLLLFTSTGLLSNAFSVFQPYIIQRGAMTESQGSLLITIRYLTMLLSTIAVTGYYRRFPLRWGMVLGLVPGLLSLVLYSAAESFLLCCVASALSGVTCGLCGMVPATMLLDRWFVSHRGLAVGICAAGTGFAAVVASPVMQWLINRFGLSGAMLWEAVFFLAAGAAVFLLVRERPEDLGLQPYHAAQRTTRREPTSAPASGGGRTMGLLLPAAFLLAASAGPAYSHITVYLTDEQFSPDTVAWLVSAMGLLMTAGKCLIGEVTDLMGGRRACLLFGMFVVLGQGLECFIPTRSSAVVCLSLLFAGLGLALSTVGFSIWCRDLCRGDNALLCKIQSAHMVGALLFSPLPGILADGTGSYQPAYLLFALLTILAVGLMARAYATPAPNRQHI